MVKRIRGTKDWIYPESLIKKNVIKKCADFLMEYGYELIETPVIERKELFTRSIGEGTDIVEKEMYEIKDRKGRILALRPEETASVARAVGENNLFESRVLKLYYEGEMFRYERPQAGRYRQFHQIGAEVIGSALPETDAEVIYMLYNLLNNVLKIKGVFLQINSIGCASCCKDFLEKLKIKIKENLNDLCGDCQRRFDKNPLRLFDCKEKKCGEYKKNYPLITQNLCGECKEHFESVKFYLDKLNVNYEINPYIARGLDYYEKTTFEFVYSDEKSQNALAAGGRYNNLIKEVGGVDLPAVGFALGTERLLAMLENKEKYMPASKKLFYFVFMTEEIKKELLSDVIKIMEDLNIAYDYLGKSFKANMKFASKIRADFVCIIGDEEFKNKTVTVKDFKTSNQSSVNLNNLKEELIKLQGS